MIASTSHSRAAIYGLSASLLALLPLSIPVRASTTPSYQLQSTGVVSFTPTATLSPGQDDLITFIFAPGASFAPAEVTARNFVYGGNWQIDAASLITNASTDLTGHYGYTLDSNNQVSTVTLYNNRASSTLSAFPPTASSPDDGVKSTTPTTTTVTLPFSSIGSSASFNLDYFDPASISTFSLLEGNTTLLSGTFDQNGVFTPTTTAPGVTESVRPLAGTAVPEPSAFALLSLGCLPLLSLARRRTSRS